MKNEIQELNQKNIRLILSISIVSAILIVLINLFVQDEYFKYCILPFSVLLIDFAILIKKTKLQINKTAFISLVPIIFILISNLILDIDPSNLIISFFILPVLISIFFFSLVNKNYAVTRTFINWFVKLFPAHFITNFNYLRKSPKSKSQKKSSNVEDLILGLCFGVPLGIILLLLLTSADKYFSVFISSIIDTFMYIFDIDFIFQNIMVFIIFFPVCYTVLINILKHKDTKEEKPYLYNLTPIISKTILGIVNMVFALFIISEISKLTGNFLSLPIEYTYAEYAREGFFQLLFVTVINFGIMMYYLYYENKSKNNLVIKTMLISLVAFSLLLVFNSYYRMFLYTSNYGFTILRLQVILFLFMELIIFIIMLKRFIVPSQKKDGSLFAFIIIGTYIINTYFCIQSFVDFLNNWLP